MKTILIFVLITIMTAFAGCSSIEEPLNDKQNVSNALETESDLTVDNVEKEVEISDTAPIIAEDEIVNQFITEYNNYSDNDISEARKGNIRTKYFVDIQGHYVELISYSEGLSISITGGQNNEAKQSMFNAFKEVLKVIDTTLTDEQINETVSYLINEEYMVSDYIISENVTLETYVPIKELSTGLTTCRLDLVAHKYK